MRIPANTPQFCSPFNESIGETPNLGPQLPICDHQSRFRNQFFKRPRTPYKTERCLKFQRGNCSYGDRCHFSHVFGDLHKFVSNSRELVAKQEGSCFRKWDMNSRPMSKLRLCRRFANGEECPYGNKCHFSHEGDEKIKGNSMRFARKSYAISILTRSEEARGDCRSGCDELEGFLYGKGLNGDRKVYQKPVAGKRRLCFKWEKTGSCPYGLKCCFAHGESELEKQGSQNALDYADKALVSRAKDSSHKRIGATHRKRVQAKKWVFKWKDVEKNSRIYADWIDDLALVHGSTLIVGS